jgi:hypothetical protein
MTIKITKRKMKNGRTVFVVGAEDTRKLLEKTRRAHERRCLRNKNCRATTY